jgi:hypothetical protein
VLSGWWWRSRCGSEWRVLSRQERSD